MIITFHCHFVLTQSDVIHIAVIAFCAICSVDSFPVAFGFCFNSLGPATRVRVPAPGPGV